MESGNFRLNWINLSLWRGDRCLQSGLNGAVESGEAITVRGPNGCGKTTLLRTLCGLCLPEDGEIQWQGQRLDRVRTSYHANMAFSGHSSGLKSDLSTRENLLLDAKIRGRQGNDTDLLQALRLQECADLPIRNLSAGQRRRASLARVLASGTALWVLDEPFTNLDSDGTSWLGRKLNQHLEKGGLLLLAAHQSSQIEPTRETVLDLSGPPA